MKQQKLADNSYGEIRKFNKNKDYIEDNGDYINLSAGERKQRKFTFDRGGGDLSFGGPWNFS